MDLDCGEAGVDYSEVRNNVTRASALTYSMVASCSGGNCPAIYVQNDGELLVQGYLAPDAHDHVTVPSGEQLVRIPRSVLLDAAAQLTAERR